MTTEELTPTQVAILGLIHATDRQGRPDSPIPGRIHLVKELFAMSTTTLGKKLVPDLSFEADNFGPFDEAIFAALDELADGGLVGFETTGDRQMIRLTPEGRKRAVSLWGRMRDDVRGLLNYVKANYNHKTSEAVLHEIYGAYPEMAKHSVSRVASRYRRKETG